MGLIRRGITGFETVSVVDFRSFKAAVYLQVNDYEPIDSTFKANKVTPNFYEAAVRHKDSTFGVICNKSLPVIAFVELPMVIAAIQPIDVPALVQVFCTAGFEVGSALELSRDLRPSDYYLLSETERNQTKYWKPVRVCDLIFNWWD